MQPPADDPTGGNNHWVYLDIVCELLDVGDKQALKIARAEGWRTARDLRERRRQYHFGDVLRTYHQRKAQP